MPTLQSHTHCQAAQANVKSKACQRVCLSQRTGDIAAKLIDNEINKQKSPVPNKRYKALGFKWLCKVSALHQSSLSGDKDAAPNSPTGHTPSR